MDFLAPTRRRGHEILDEPGVDPATRVRSINDVARSNVLFGGRRAALHAVDDVLAPGDDLVLLDVGTGLADIPEAIVRRAGTRGARVMSIGVDEAFDLLPTANRRLAAAVCGDAKSLPFRDHSVDIVICSQMLHHFAGEQLHAVIRELNRVARRRVVIADLRRSRIAAAGFWLASFPLGFHPITRHDGVVSVFRGFTGGELRECVHLATGARAEVRRHLGFRLTASWTPV